jgi:type IV pilus assembly protein PilV
MKMNIVNRLSAEEGFTLIEVVIALGIVSIGILSLMALQVNTIRGNAFANSMTRATYAGSDIIELLGSRTYSDPVFSTAAGANPHTHAELPSAILGSGVTGVNWNVVNGGIPNTKDITVTVTYRDKNLVKNLVLNFNRGQLL